MKRAIRIAACGGFLAAFLGFDLFVSTRVRGGSQ